MLSDLYSPHSEISVIRIFFVHRCPFAFVNGVCVDLFAASVFELFDYIFEEWQFVPIILELRRIDDYLQLC